MNKDTLSTILSVAGKLLELAAEVLENNKEDKDDE